MPFELKHSCPCNIHISAPRLTNHLLFISCMAGISSSEPLHFIVYQSISYSPTFPVSYSTVEESKFFLSENRKFRSIHVFLTLNCCHSYYRISPKFSISSNPLCEIASIYQDHILPLPEYKSRFSSHLCSYVSWLFMFIMLHLYCGIRTEEFHCILSDSVFRLPLLL